MPYNQTAWEEDRAPQGCDLSAVPGPEWKAALRSRLLSVQPPPTYADAKNCPGFGVHLTRTYSSWLNQVEIWFARIERDVIARGVFTSVQDLSRKLMRYIRAYSKHAQPFQWKYSDTSKRIKPC